MISAQQFAKNWADGMTNNTQKMTAGVQAVQQAPSQAAIAQQQKLVTNFNAAVQNGKWANALQGVTLQAWQQAYIQKGIPRVADAARLAQPKVQAFATQFLPFVQQLQQTVKAMPKTSAADSEQRVLAWMRGMKGFTYQKV